VTVVVTCEDVVCASAMPVIIANATTPAANSLLILAIQYMQHDA
jgi:hypothetical protein